MVYGLVLGLLSTFRREVGTLGMASIGAYVIFLQFSNGQISDRAKRWAFSAAVVLAVFVGTQAPQWGMRGAWFLRDCLYEMTDPAEFRNPGHPLWHPVYLGLGVVPNKYGIRWDDAVGGAHAERYFPGVQYGSADYERAMRALFFRVLADDPFLLVRNIAVKAAKIAALHGPVILVMSLERRLSSFSPRSQSRC